MSELFFLNGKPMIKVRNTNCMIHKRASLSQKNNFFSTLKITVIAFFALVVTNSNASIIIADPADAMVINTGGASALNLSVVDAADLSLRSGRFDDATDAPLGSNTSVVVPFLLPDFGATTDPFSTATFNFTLEQAATGNPPHSLFGLQGTRTSPTVLPEDFQFAGQTGTTGETLLESNLIVNGDPAGDITSTDISAFLNAQYANGAGAGEYVFLRLNPSAGNAALFNGTNNGAVITSADAATNQPFIEFTSDAPIIPEPTHFLLFTFVLGLVTTSRRRRRV